MALAAFVAASVSAASAEAGRPASGRGEEQQRPPLLDGGRQHAAAVERLVDQKAWLRIRALVDRQLNLGAELGIAAVARALERVALRLVLQHGERSRQQALC